MAKSTKPKMIVREIKSQMKVTEIKKEEPSEESGEEFHEEASLEDIATEVPSVRDFPTLSGGGVQEQRAEPETQTPAATTEAENRAATRYDVQTEVTEGEIRRNYQTTTSETRASGSRSPVIMGSERVDRGELFRNREVEAMRGSEQDDDKYDISVEPKPSSSKRKYPWEM